MLKKWPTWPQLGPQDGAQVDPKSEKIDAKIDRKIDASWDRFLEGFWWIFGGKMEACWHQNRAKIDANFEERFFEKTLFFLKKNNDFEGSRDRSWR